MHQEKHNLQRNDELIPDFQRHFGQTAINQKGTVGKPKSIGNPITELERQHGGLPGDMEHIGKRYHDGHDSHCLTAPGRDQRIDEQIDDEHTHSRTICGSSPH